MTAGRADRIGHALAGAARHAAGLLAELLPPACVVCRSTVAPGPPLCGLCESRLPFVPRPWCARCGAPDTSVVVSPGCDACDPWPAELARAASAVLHTEPADALVAGFKYRGWTALAPKLGALMEAPARRLVSGRDVRLLPVPLDPRRARRRGYNQAALLAEALATRTGWSLAPAGLRRRPSRARQAELGREERHANVRSTLAWDPAVSTEGSPLLLVDDVLTTGATAAACAAAIRAVGGRCLGVVTFARAVPRPDEG